MMEEIVRIAVKATIWKEITEKEVSRSNYNGTCKTYLFTVNFYGLSAKTDPLQIFIFLER